MPSKIATIREFMSTCPETIEADELLSEARSRMTASGIRHLPVVRDGRLVGLLSDRDVLLAESLLRDDAHRSRTLVVREAMTEVVFTCGPEAHLHAVAHEMAHDKHGSAIVVDPMHPTKVLGVFTTIDALRALSRYAPQE
jgi:acetoin utilization protein AcuB